MTMQDVLALPVADRDWLLARIAAERKREADAIEKAGKKRTR